VESVRDIGQGVQIGTGTGADAKTKKSGESEAEVQIGGRDDIEAEARIGGDMRETIANQDGMMVGGQEEADLRITGAVDEIATRVKINSRFDKELGNCGMSPSRGITSAACSLPVMSISL
jgi:hypothetical protein